MSTTTKSLLPLRLAARRIGIKPDTLRAAAERGEIPSLKIGDELLFDVESVERELFERAERERQNRKAVNHAG
jgi:hypothetical protein